MTIRSWSGISFWAASIMCEFSAEKVNINIHKRHTSDWTRYGHFLNVGRHIQWCVQPGMNHGYENGFRDFHCSKKAHLQQCPSRPCTLQCPTLLSL